MAYTPKTWECGDIITPNELNRMEQGIEEALGSGGSGGDGVFLITPIDTEASPMVFDKTEEEIIEAIDSNKNVKLAYSPSGGAQNGIVTFLDVARVTRSRPNHEVTPSGELLTEYGVGFAGEYGAGTSVYLVYATMTFSPLEVIFDTFELNGQN